MLLPFSFSFSYKFHDVCVMSHSFLLGNLKFLLIFCNRTDFVYLYEHIKYCKLNKFVHICNAKRNSEYLKNSVNSGKQCAYRSTITYNGISNHVPQIVNWTLTRIINKLITMHSNLPIYLWHIIKSYWLTVIYTV